MKTSFQKLIGIPVLAVPLAITGCSNFGAHHQLDGYGVERAAYVQEKLNSLNEGPPLPRTHSTYGASIGNHRHRKAPRSSSHSVQPVVTVEEEVFQPTEQWVPVKVQNQIPPAPAPEVAFRAPAPAYVPVAAPASPAPAGNEMLPPNARPGECYARVFAAPKYESRTERVLVKEGGERIEIIPAEYKMVQEQVLVEAESERLEVVDAVYETRKEQVMISPPTTQVKEIPARYDTVEENVLVKPASTAWKSGSGPIEKIDGATGEIMCLVEVPAEYKKVTRKKLIAPATTRTVNIPAEYKDVTRKVMVRPPQTRSVKIPARYDTIPVRKMVRPAQERKIPVEPEFDVVTKEVKVSEGSTVWQRVLCETNLTLDMVKSIQTALLDFGYDPGAADGSLGAKTQAAIQQFQTDRKLAIGGITYETVRNLGLEL